MQAILNTLTPARSPYEDQIAYLRVAVWMVDFLNRVHNGRFSIILRHLKQAQYNATDPRRSGTKPVSVPGGPALRLAKALWALHYRLAYPKDDQLIHKEERHSAHLEYHHRDASKNSPVWKAMEHFLTLRKDLLGGIPVPEPEKEDIFRPNPFTRALRLLDTFIQGNRRLRQRLLLPELLSAVANAHPDNQPLLLTFVTTMDAYAHILIHPSGVAEGKNLQLGYQALTQTQYENRAYLSTHHKLAHAIYQLLYAIREAKPSI